MTRIHKNTTLEFGRRVYPQRFPLSTVGEFMGDMGEGARDFNKKETKRQKAIKLFFERNV
jgi:hypothetical protein